MRKQMGMIEAELLDRVDLAAKELGQTRRVFVERALEAALERPASSSAKATSTKPARSSRPRQQSAAMARQAALNKAKGL